MERMDVIAWVMSVCSDLRLSQSKTLSELVAASVRVGRISLAAIGRSLAGPCAAKHRIKRTWRFVANPRVVVSDAMRGLVRHLSKRYVKLQRRGQARRPSLLIALDWTDIRNFMTLMAAAVQRGRAVPLLWATYPKWRVFKSQNNFEEGLLLLLRDMIPTEVKVILLADRGFARTELARTCQRLGFHYVIRTIKETWIECSSYRGRLEDYPVRKGMQRFLSKVRYRKKNPVEQHMVICWKIGLPKKRDEPWFLMTDLKQKVETLTILYGKRMTIEEWFRDAKNKRNGFSLRHTKITKADRLERLLLILVLAYWLLVGLGLVAQQRHRPSMWCSSTRQRECSIFTIGRVMIERMQVKAPVLFTTVVIAIIEGNRNWG